MADRKKKTPKVYSAQQVADFARSLRLVADRIDCCATTMQSEGVESLPVASWRSGELAVKHFASFSRSLNASLDAKLLSDSRQDS